MVTVGASNRRTARDWRFGTMKDMGGQPDRFRKYAFRQQMRRLLSIFVILVVELPGSDRSWLLCSKMLVEQGSSQTSRSPACRFQAAGKRLHAARYSVQSLHEGDVHCHSGHWRIL